MNFHAFHLDDGNGVRHFMNPYLRAMSATDR
jgi:hypothetical protein